MQISRTKPFRRLTGTVIAALGSLLLLRDGAMLLAGLF
jgi:hypothetical protein